MKEHTTRREPLIKRPRKHTHHRLPNEAELRASHLREPTAEDQPPPPVEGARPEPVEGAT